MKVLEGQGSKGKGYPTKVGRPSPGFARSPPAPKRSRRGPASPWRTVAALVVVGLLVAVATGWVLRPQSVIPGQPPDGSEPRWKDESATHFTFAAAGAFDGPGDANSVAVLERARAAGMSFFLALGDLGNTADGAGWCRQMRQYVPEIVFVAGAREAATRSGDNGSKDIASCPYPLRSPIASGNGTAGYGYEYYFDYPYERPLARFIILAAGLDGSVNYNYSKKSLHTEWMEGAVDSARKMGIRWVIAGVHYNCLSVSHSKRCPMGQAIFDELIEAKVDLILVGQGHAYERSKQLGLSGSCESIPSADEFESDCVADDGRYGEFTKGKGTLVVAQGVGGARFDPVAINGSDPELGYFGAVMGGNGNTQGRLSGFGSVFYRVTANSIVAETDFCPSNASGEKGRCTANPGDVFADRFSIYGPDPFVPKVRTQPQRTRAPS